MIVYTKIHYCDELQPTGRPVGPIPIMGLHSYLWDSNPTCGTLAGTGTLDDDTTQMRVQPCIPQAN